MSFGDTLLIIFIVLKLAGLVNWDWYWVLSPIWGSLIIYCLMVLFSKKEGAT